MANKELVRGVTISKSSCPSVRDALKEKCIGCLLSQWERYSRKGNCSVYIVMCVDQCSKSQLGEGNTLSLSLMIIPDVVRFTL